MLGIGLGSKVDKKYWNHSTLHIISDNQLFKDNVKKYTFSKTHNIQFYIKSLFVNHIITLVNIHNSWIKSLRMTHIVNHIL